MAQAIGNFAAYTAPQQGIYDPLAVGINAFMGGTQYAADRRAQEQERTFVEQQRGRARKQWLTDDEINARAKEIDDEENSLLEKFQASVESPIPLAPKPQMDGGFSITPAEAPAAGPLAGVRVSIPQRGALSTGPQPEVSSGFDVAPMVPPTGGALAGAKVNIPQRAALSTGPQPVVAAGAQPAPAAAATPPAISPGETPPGGALAGAGRRGLPTNDPALLRVRMQSEYRRAQMFSSADAVRYGDRAATHKAAAQQLEQQYMRAGTAAASAALRGGSPDAFERWKQQYPDLAMMAAVDDVKLLRTTEIAGPGGYSMPAYVFADASGNPLPPIPHTQVEARIGGLMGDPDLLDKHMAYARQVTVDAAQLQQAGEQSKRGDQQLREMQADREQRANQFDIEQKNIAARWGAEMKLKLRELSQREYELRGTDMAKTEEKLTNALVAVDKQYPVYEAAVKGSFKTDSSGALMAGAGGLGEMRVTVNGKTMPVSTAFGPDARIGMDRVAAFAASIEKFSIMNNGLAGKKGPADAARLGVIGATLADLSNRQGANVAVTLEDGRIARIATSDGVPYLQIERRTQKFSGDVPRVEATEREVYPLSFDLYMGWYQSQKSAPQGAIR